MRESYEAFAADRKTTGLPRIKELLGDEVAQRLAKWFKGHDDVVVGDFHLTETGDAECFAKAGADVVRFDHVRERWLIREPAPSTDYALLGCGNLGPAPSQLLLPRVRIRIPRIDARRPCLWTIVRIETAGIIRVG